mmetsp:Transcript_7288/g.15140  ORF Transcript_7288/g.15140 Transcript_7288/m.15140 type:complete len:464 (-) Transcript_7288:151-1542(-)
MSTAGIIRKMSSLTPQSDEKRSRISYDKDSATNDSAMVIKNPSLQTEGNASSNEGMDDKFRDSMAGRDLDELMSEEDRLKDKDASNNIRAKSLVRTLSNLFVVAPNADANFHSGLNLNDFFSDNESIEIISKSSYELVSRRTFDSCYDLQEKVLGRGTFAEVKVGVHRESKQEYAVKIISKDRLSRKDKTHLMDEVSILQSLKHHRIVSLVDYFDGEMDVVPAPNYYLVMDLVEGGELFDRVVERSSYTEADARLLCRILLGAMEYMHGKGIAHRDLKPENIFLESDDNDYCIKIGDFGLAKRVTHPKSLRSTCGTLGYMAPEVMLSRPYGLKADMWSVGVIIFVLLGGYHPFGTGSILAIMKRVLREPVKFNDQHWGKVSDGPKELIRAMLTVVPDRRIDAADSLESNWMHMNSESLAERDLFRNIESMAQFNARSKFKGAVRSVMWMASLNKFTRKGSSVI